MRASYEIENLKDSHKEGSGHNMLPSSSLKFVDDADLVEHERDELQRILYQPRPECVSQFPDSLKSLVFTSESADYLPQSSESQRQSDSSVDDESTTSFREEQSTTEECDDREEDDRYCQISDSVSANKTTLKHRAQAASASTKKALNSHSTQREKPGRRVPQRNAVQYGGYSSNNCLVNGSTQLPYNVHGTNVYGYMPNITAQIPVSPLMTGAGQQLLQPSVNVPPPTSGVTFLHHMPLAVPGLSYPANPAFLVPQMVTRMPGLSQQPQLQPTFPASAPVTSNAGGYFLSNNVAIPPQFASSVFQQHYLGAPLHPMTFISHAGNVLSNTTAPLALYNVAPPPHQPHAQHTISANTSEENISVAVNPEHMMEPLPVNVVADSAIVANSLEPVADPVTDLAVDKAQLTTTGEPVNADSYVASTEECDTVFQQEQEYPGSADEVAMKVEELSFLQNDSGTADVEFSHDCSPASNTHNEEPLPQSNLAKATSETNISDDTYEDAIEDLVPEPVAEEKGLASSVPKKPAETASAITETNRSEPETVSSSAKPPVPPSDKGKSWASLFQNTTTANKATVVITTDAYENGDSDADCQRAIEASLADGHRAPAHNVSRFTGRWPASDAEIEVVNVRDDFALRRILYQINRIQFNHRGAPFQLRGLTNCGNWCYVNATLQALISCPPFYHFMNILSRELKRQPTSTPVLDAFCRFVSEFQSDRKQQIYTPRRYNQRELDVGSPFEPTFVYKVMSRFSKDRSFTGRQEDAEEFLSRALDLLHEELMAVIAVGQQTSNDSVNTFHPSDVAAQNDEHNNASNDDWHQVGPNRKALITREAKLERSPIADIFAGKLRYSTQAAGCKESVVLQPFFVLPLEIQSPEIKDVETALGQIILQEHLRCLKTENKQKPSEVDTIRRASLDELPIVLVLQLKYFSYGETGLKKNIKNIHFKIDLQLKPELLSPNAQKKYRPPMLRQYKLFAVVYHHGEKAEGGHYTSAIFHGGGWVHVDDTRMTALTDPQLSAFEPPRVPYLLFYRRADTISSQQQDYKS